MIRLGLILSAIALTGAARAGAFDNIYDDQELAALQPRYERGYHNIYDKDITPILTAEENARFANVPMGLERRVADREPFGFYSTPDQVVISTSSLKFLFDITLAERWLDMNGLDIGSVRDYLTMLQFWDASRGRPPEPLAALCIPPESAMVPKIVEMTDEIFNDAGLFVLLHEYGHVFYHHPGNLAVEPKQSRANEQAADMFALNIFARLGAPPAGVSWFFYVATNLLEFRTDAGSVSQQNSLASRTHPVSPERLQAVADNIAAWAEAYAKGFKTGSSASAMALALQISQLGHTLADPVVQRFTIQIGRTVSPVDLAPRPKGRNLSAPCDGRSSSGLPYDGTLRGTFHAGGVDTNLDMVLRQDGKNVSGSFGYGNGIGRVIGQAQNAKLTYHWTLGAESGVGVIAAQEGGYRGNWGYGAASTGGGTFELTKAHESAP